MDETPRYTLIRARFDERRDRRPAPAAAPIQLRHFRDRKHPMTQEALERAARDAERIADVLHETNRRKRTHAATVSPFGALT